MSSVGGRLAISWSVVLWLLLLFFLVRVQPERWVGPHLAVRTLFDCCR